jgi:hypothetical protein
MAKLIHTRFIEIDGRWYALFQRRPGRETQLFPGFFRVSDITPNVI